jgi:hypothetical protein
LVLGFGFFGFLVLPAGAMFGFAWGLAGIRVCAFSWRGRFGLVWFGLVWFAWVFAGIRDALAHFKRRPCAGRHLLFFAAAKKSRQKKAAHTAST